MVGGGKGQQAGLGESVRSEGVLWGEGGKIAWEGKGEREGLGEGGGVKTT